MGGPMGLKLDIETLAVSNVDINQKYFLIIINKIIYRYKIKFYTYSFNPLYKIYI